MNRTININGPIIQFWPYRKARTQDWACCIPLSNEDLAYLRHKMTRNHLTLDNHIVFATENSLFWYSDNKLYVGGTLVLGSY